MIAALRAAETKTERSGGAGRKRGLGKMNFRPALTFSPPQFFVPTKLARHPDLKFFLDGKLF